MDPMSGKYMSDPSRRLRLLPIFTRDATLLVAEGELDLGSGLSFERALLDVEDRQGGRPMTLDLSRLKFVDVTGARAVYAARRRAERAGRQLLVRYPTGPARRIFDLLDSRAG